MRKTEKVWISCCFSLLKKSKKIYNYVSLLDTEMHNYLTGFVKEGAGAGGAMFTALVLGSSVEELRKKIEKVCE